MENSIISEVTEYCAKTGITPIALGIRVSQNSRLIARLERRIATVTSDSAKLRAYMTAHPIEAK